MPRSNVSPGSRTRAHDPANALHVHPSKTGYGHRNQSHSLLRHECDASRSFLLCTGAIIRSPKQLADALEHVDDSVYFYHVPTDRNDFAQWIQDVFHEDALASRLRSCHSREQLRATIYQYLLDHTSKKK